MPKNFAKPGVPPTPTLMLHGVAIFRGLLDAGEQAVLLSALRDVAAAAPLFSPQTRRGRPMSVRMTSAGAVGWYSDRSGYCYRPRHPGGMPWPPIPVPALAVWDRVTGLERRPDCALINFYRAGARMGLHQDRDEKDFSWPVVSVSLGDDGLFRVGRLACGGSTESLWLRSGDVVVLGGAARLIHHGIDRIRPGSSALIPDGGRVNLTLRVTGHSPAG